MERRKFLSSYFIFLRLYKPNYFRYPPEYLTIRAGSTERLQGGDLRKVVKVVMHENYNGSNNDIALLEIDLPLIFSKNIQAIPLATEEVPAGEPVVISGWGRLWQGGDIPYKLQWNTLVSLSKAQCLRKILQSSDGLICLDHAADNGACNGDSGGPAVYGGKLVGVANFVVVKCGSDRPDGYAKVSYHLDWIKANSDV